MIILPSYSVLFGCFVYIGLALSKPLEPTIGEKLNQVLQELGEDTYGGFLLYSIPAASAGKNFFKMPHNLSEDCVRTARAIMQSLAKPSTGDQAQNVIYQSCANVAKDKSSRHFQRRVNTTCANINEEVKKWPSDFHNFDELKRNVELPYPAKNYIYEIPSDQNVLDWLKGADMIYEDVEMLEFELATDFINLEPATATDQNGLDLIGTRKAIEQLSTNPNYRSTVDDVFSKAIRDFTKEVRTQNRGYDKSLSVAFVNRVNRYFLESFLIQEPYKEVKKRVVDDVKNDKTDE